MSTTCVISQPTFLPWIGWFDLADQADVMIILDDVSFSKQSWQQRNRIRTPAGLEFLTVPVKSSGRFGQRILDCELANTLFVEKMLKAIHLNYAKAPFYADCFAELETTMTAGAAGGGLAELNMCLIQWLARRLGVETPMTRSSAMRIGGHRGEHVAAICQAVGANVYLSPAGAEAYLAEDKSFFEERGISVMLHAYEHPEYQQRFQPFVPFASALDLVLNMGPQAPEIMRSGRRPPRPLGEPAEASITHGSQK